MKKFLPLLWALPALFFLSTSFANGDYNKKKKMKRSPEQKALAQCQQTHAEQYLFEQGVFVDITTDICNGKRYSEKRFFKLVDVVNKQRRNANERKLKIERKTGFACDSDLNNYYNIENSAEGNLFGALVTARRFCDSNFNTVEQHDEP